MCETRVITIDRPRSRLDSELLLFQSVDQIVTVFDAMAVSDDQRWAFIGFGIQESLESLLIVIAHGDTSNVNITISHGDQTEIFLGQTFTAHGEFGYCGARRGL